MGLIINEVSLVVANTKCSKNQYYMTEYQIYSITKNEQLVKCNFILFNTMKIDHLKCKTVYLNIADIIFERYSIRLVNFTNY